MSVVVDFARSDEIAQISEVTCEAGLSNSAADIRHYFFDSPCKGPDAEVIGGFVIRDEGRVVGYQGVSPCSVWAEGKEYQGYQLGVLGVKKGYGVALFELMDRVVDLSKRSVVYANTANVKSSKLWTGYAGFVPGPKLCAYMQYSVMPVGAVFKFGMKPQVENVFDERYDVLWEKVKNGASGVMTDRSSARLRWLYGDGLRNGKLTVLSLENGGCLQGYVVLKKKALPKFNLSRFEIMDICTSPEVLGLEKRLLQKAECYSSFHGGVMLEYIGSKKILPRYRHLASNVVFSKTGIDELVDKLRASTDCFFGPADGDRVL